MSDLTVRAPCEHGRYDQHEIDARWSGHVAGRENTRWKEMCPGGREIRLRKAGLDAGWQPQNQIVWVEVDDDE